DEFGVHFNGPGGDQVTEPGPQRAAGGQFILGLAAVDRRDISTPYGPTDTRPGGVLCTVSSVQQGAGGGVSSTDHSHVAVSGAVPISAMNIRQGCGDEAVRGCGGFAGGGYPGSAQRIGLVPSAPGIQHGLGGEVIFSARGGCAADYSRSVWAQGAAGWS